MKEGRGFSQFSLGRAAGGRDGKGSSHAKKWTKIDQKMERKVQLLREIFGFQKKKENEHNLCSQLTAWLCKCNQGPTSRRRVEIYTKTGLQNGAFKG